MYLLIMYNQIACFMRRKFAGYLRIHCAYDQELKIAFAIEVTFIFPLQTKQHIQPEFNALHVHNINTEVFHLSKATVAVWLLLLVLVRTHPVFPS